MVSGVTGVNSALLDQANVAGAAAAATAPARETTIDQHQFLMLFISQLQHQDPLDPLDANGLTAQLAQFSSLEQLVGINENLAGVQQLLGSRGETDLVGYLGREVTVTGGTVELTAGEATPVTLTVPATARSVQVSVLSPEGQVVRRLDLGPQSAGALAFVFDGKDARGAAVADGHYTIEATMRDELDVARTVPTLVRGVVTGVDLTSDVPVLIVGTRRVTLDQVREVRVPSES
jgi:flagellar basal-body rod modification protein FlgD